MGYTSAIQSLDETTVARFGSVVDDPVTFVDEMSGKWPPQSIRRLSLPINIRGFAEIVNALLAISA
jgi:hypothetical protein